MEIAKLDDEGVRRKYRMKKAGKYEFVKKDKAEGDLTCLNFIPHCFKIIELVLSYKLQGLFSATSV